MATMATPPPIPTPMAAPFYNKMMAAIKICLAYSTEEYTSGACGTCAFLSTIMYNTSSSSLTSLEVELHFSVEIIII